LLFKNKGHYDEQQDQSTRDKRDLRMQIKAKFFDIIFARDVAMRFVIKAMLRI